MIIDEKGVGGSAVHRGRISVSFAADSGSSSDHHDRCRDWGLGLLWRWRSGNRAAA